MNASSNKPSMTIASFLWSLIRPYRWCYLIMALGPLSSAIYPIVYNYAIKLVVDLFTTHSESITLSKAFPALLCFMGAHFILDGGWRLHNIGYLKSIPYVSQALMERATAHLFGLSYGYFQSNMLGAILVKVRGLGDGYFKIHESLESKLGIKLPKTIFAGLAMAWVNVKLFWAVLGFILLYTPLAQFFFLRLSKMEQAKQQSWNHFFGHLADCLQNIYSILLYASKKREVDGIKQYYENQHNPLAIRHLRYRLWITIILSLVYWLFFVLIFLLIIHLKNTGAISTGSIAFSISLVIVFTESAWELTQDTSSFLENLASFKEAFTLMNVEPCVLSGPGLKKFNIMEGRIRFQNLGFGYGSNKFVLKNLSLTIEPGEKVGLVGGTGAGKSTLAGLVLKNFLATSGQVLIDEQDLLTRCAHSIREHIAVIPQETMLFQRSIRENISYSNPRATYDEIQEAARVANIHTFINSLPQGYETTIGASGVQLSGGQRQRIAIARAVLSNAKILILDEATSSLDSETEFTIQQSINQLLAQKKQTVIAIAHRFSTLKCMDRIIVMDEGTITEQGSFNQLIAQGKKFSALWKYQN